MGENFGSDPTPGTASQVQSQVAGPAPPEVFVAMPLLQQAGEVYVGPGAKKEAELLGLGLTKLSSRRKDDLHLAKRYAMDISIKQIMLRQQKAHQENQQKQSMYAQALSLMARVYIGSISFEVREDNIKKAFEVFGPIKTINMSFDPTTGHHKGFAFLEFDVPEAALLAQDSMNGQLMGGRNLKVGRPSNMPQAQPIIEMVQQDAKKYHRVYVASVHPDLSESDLKSVFEAFGEVVKCQLARQNASGRGTHRGFGYIEFNNAAAMNEAIAGMNMFDLGGQYLRVGRCITPPEALQYLTPSTQVAIPAAAAVAAAAVTAKVMAAEAAGSSKSGSPAQDSRSSRGNSPALALPPARNSPAYSETATPPHFAHSPNVRNSLASQSQPRAIEAPPSTDSAPATPPIVSSPLAFDQVGYQASPPQGRTSGRGFGGFAQDIPPLAGTPPAFMPPPGVMGFPPGTVAPPGLVPPPGLMPPPGLVPPPGLLPPPGAFTPTGIAPPPPPQPTVAAPPPPPPTQVAAADEKKNKGDRSFNEKLNRLLDRQKAKQNATLAQPISFGELDPMIAPRDALEPRDEDAQTQLAITGSVESMALAILGDGQLVAAGKLKEHDPTKPKEDGKKKKQHYRGPYEPKKIQPKLNSLQALAAAEKAGALSDAVIADTMNSEDATLASQEGVFNIRGNDARHLLMAKLMRTNRSCVLVLRNMVTPEQIDEFLEEEIKGECSKYGTVIEVVIANDEANGAVKIFVRFSDPTEVDSARAGLDNRFFDGRTVKAEVYDQALFDHNDLTG
ncbi:unnamed protein product [Auanema sp. JU1783]|nr:unnamed protein product [Auanema sp. JU1783]